LVLLTMLAPVVENRTVSFTRERDQLQLGDEANSIRRSPTALRHGQLSSPWRSGRRFANFQRQRGPAGPWNYGFWLLRGRTPYTPLTADSTQFTRAARRTISPLYFSLYREE